MKYLMCLIFVNLMMGSAYAQGLGDVSEWTVDPATGCKTFNPTPEPKETIKFSGTCLDGYTNGWGTVQWFRDGIAGNAVTGTYLKGDSSGKVMVRYPNGDVYEGFLENGGLKSGEGTYTFARGNKYVGEFKDDKYDGQGTFTFTNGGKYVGEFKDDKRNGQGTYIYASGSKYVGEWKDGKWNGRGIYNYADGSKYVGEYKDGKENGLGTITFDDGSKIVSEFKDGKMNGQGIMYDSDGSITSQGIWADNKLVSSAPVQQAIGRQSKTPVCPLSGYSHNCFGTNTDAVGNKYVGEYKDNTPNGRGTFTRADGSKYVGEFKDGKIDGRGTLTTANGSKYVGEFKDGKMNGRVTVYDLDGSIASQGIWADNKPVISAPLQ